MEFRIKQYQQQQQVAWEKFVQQRTYVETSYANAIRHAKQSSYQPLKEYAEDLPETLAELCPTFYLPMQEYVSDDEYEAERAKYNEIANKINAFNDEIMDKVIEANKKFEESGHTD